MDDKMNDVINEVQKKLGEEYEVKRVEVMKNNDTKLKGIQVRRKDMNVAKICYWTSESVDEIVAVINRSLFPKFDCEINLEKLKDRIVYTLVNADSNKSRLKTIPYRLLKGTDLAITYKLIIDIDFNATASSDVTNALMEHLGVTENGKLGTFVALGVWGSGMIENCSFNLGEFYVKMEKMNRKL